MLSLSSLCTAEEVAILNPKQYAVLPHQVPALWGRVQVALGQPIPNHAALCEAISTITGKAQSSLAGIAALQPTHDVHQRFWTTAIGFMQLLVLRMPDLFPGNMRLPLLTTGIEAQVTLSQEQIAALLACSFFGAIIQPSNRAGSFPEFALLFVMEDASFSPVLDCVIHYFCSIADALPQGRVTFERKAWRSKVRWDSREHDAEGALPLCPVEVFKAGTIEDSGSLIHADFANQFIGGGVLEGGRVQEEILFSIKPECLVSMLFCSVMKPYESITITGAQRFTSYSGYGRSFACAGDYQDQTPLDEHHRRRCLIIAMDAVVAYGGKQWDNDAIERDVVKALCAFSQSPIGAESTAPLSPVSDLWSTIPEDNGKIATGNWGCGAFGGDKALKFMQQWVAASIARREGVQYFTFGEDYQQADMEQLLRRCSAIAQDRHLVVADLYDLIRANKQRNLFEAFFAQYGQQQA